MNDDLIALSDAELEQMDARCRMIYSRYMTIGATRAMAIDVSRLLIEVKRLRGKQTNEET
jgi:hypothetical protein